MTLYFLSFYLSRFSFYSNEFDSYIQVIVFVTFKLRVESVAFVECKINFTGRLYAVGILVTVQGHALSNANCIT